MSQRITYDVAKTLKKGDVLYHNIIVLTGEDGDTFPATAVVTGKAKPHSVEEFMLPIRRQYGDEGVGYVSKFGTDLWRTTPEKITPRHVVRTRHSEVEDTESAEPDEQEGESVRRVRRGRSKPAEVSPARRVRRSR